MAQTAEEKAAAKRELAEALADGLEIFKAREEEAKAKAQKDAPSPEDDKDESSFMDKFLSWIA